MYFIIQGNQAQINMYPDQFDRTDSFTGEYQIVLQTDNHSVIHTPRKCLIHMRDEIKTELDGMMEQGIIHRVSELTEWVNSLVYIRKSNGSFYLRLYPQGSEQSNCVMSS